MEHIDINEMLSKVAATRATQFVLGRHKIGDDVQYFVAPDNVQKQFAVMQAIAPQQLAIQRGIMNKAGWDFVLIDLQTFAVQPFPVAPAPDAELGDMLEADGKLKPEVEKQLALGG